MSQVCPDVQDHAVQLSREGEKEREAHPVVSSVRKSDREDVTKIAYEYARAYYVVISSARA